MAQTPRTLTLSLLTGRYAVAKLPAGVAIPGSATQGEFFSVTRTADELSLVTAERNVPAGARVVEGWRVFKVHGSFEFSEVGVLASLTEPLARENVAVFVVSTFDTDYLLVREENLHPAITAMQRAGHQLLGI
jgi:uncharacterized protein